MKVLDLTCGHGHRFEGWFDSESDYLDQVGRHFIECPVCGNAAIAKCLSAPRLNLGRADVEEPKATEMAVSVDSDLALQSAWMALAERIVANTDDVGASFAEEARKIHYGEAKERGIRGQASPDDAQALLDEGIEVMLLPLSEITGLTQISQSKKH